MTSSIYDVIAAGDVVEIADADRNVVQGRMHLLDGDRMFVEAFGVLIPFARRNRAGTWVAEKKVRLVGHQAPLFGALS